MGLLKNTALPPKERLERSFTLGDVIVILFLVAFLYGGARLAFDAPAFIEGPQISLNPSTLPWYTLLSVGRMLAAYILSLLFTLTYGRTAAYNRRAEAILMPLLQSALQEVLKELRLIASSLGIPQLDELSFSDVVLRAVILHEQRSGTAVKLDMHALPDYVPLPVKIAVYRLIQEALSNSHRHGGGAGQEVNVAYERQQLDIEVTDQGSGFDVEAAAAQGESLGLAGIRERVESLGGLFLLQSQPGAGTRLFARFTLENRE